MRENDATCLLQEFIPTKNMCDNINHGFLNNILFSQNKIFMEIFLTYLKD